MEQAKTMGIIFLVIGGGDWYLSFYKNYKFCGSVTLLDTTIY